MKISPTGTLIAGASQIISLWVLTTGELKNRFVGSNDIVTKMVFSPDEQLLLTLAVEDVPMLWDLETGENLAMLSSSLTTGNTVTDIQITGKGNILTFDSEGASTWVADLSGPFRRDIDSVSPFVSNLLDNYTVLVGGLEGSLSLLTCEP
jgi:WD40 repeat protein